MPEVYNLKTWPHFFKEVKSGKKPFEVRKNDRDFKVGDTLILNEFDPYTQKFTGNWTPQLITYILDDPQFVKEGYVIMGLKEIRV